MPKKLYGILLETAKAAVCLAVVGFLAYFPILLVIFQPNTAGK